MPAPFWAFLFAIVSMIVVTILEGTTLVLVLALAAFAACCTVLLLMVVKCIIHGSITNGDLITIFTLFVGAAMSLRYIV